MSHDIERDFITPAQLRAARALLRLPAKELAKIAGVSLVTIRRAEALDGAVRMMPANAAVLRHALEVKGVEFIAAGSAGEGVRLREPQM